MDDTPPSQFVTPNECRLATKYLHDKISDVEITNDKILKILQGNGDGGLLWKVNVLMLRNQWLDKGVGVIIGIGSSLLTLWLTGVLHL